MSAVTPSRAKIGHNSASFAEIVEADPSVVFRDEEVRSGLVAEIEAEIKGATYDLSTDKGRRAISSMAAAIARRKTSIDAAGKELNEDHRKAINLVDAIRRDVREKLDGLRDRARAPLTAWEEAEQSRIDHVEKVIASLSNAAYVQIGATVADVDAAMASVAAVTIDLAIFREREPVAAKEKTRALEALSGAKARIQKEEQERAELERLRAEREKQAQREQAEKAERDRERAALAAAEEAKRREAEAARIAAERAVAEERRKAEVAAEAERRKHEEQLAAERRERARLEQEAREKEDAARRAREDEERRQADRDHRATVMGQAKAALMEHGGIREDAAKKVVLAIVAGSIPNVSLRW